MAAEFTIDLTFLREGLDQIERNARVALEAGLDDMANRAKAHAPVGESGILKQSIRRGAVTGSLASGTLSGDLSATAPGAEAQEFGSGIHGERGAKYPIVPKRKRALRFPIGGSVASGDAGFRFAKKVMHPGVRARRFLQQGVEEGMPNLEEELVAAIALGAR